MDKQESLVAAYLLDGKGGGKKLHWDEVKNWTPEQGVLWIHLNYAAKQSIRWLTKYSGLDTLTIHAMTAEETRPRSLVNNDKILVFLRAVNLNPGEDPEDMVSIRIWLDKHRIISTRQRRLLSVDDIRKSIEQGIGPKTPQEFLRQINDRMTERMSDVIEAIDEKADALEENIITSESYLLRPKISEVRRQAIMLRRYLAPQREALNRLYLEEHSLLTDTDRMYMRESTDRIMRYVEDLDSIHERAAISQEELTSRLSEQLNKRMYILSVVAVIFIPLTFITGLLGINVGGIPGAHNPWAFFLVCSMLVTIMLVMLWAFHRKAWL